jgi:hypothetical protein
MFLYQALIMAVVVVAIYVLAYFLKSKNRKILVISIIALVLASGVGLYAVQYIFGNHFYTQELDASALEGVSITSQQKQEMQQIFSDYKEINDDTQSADALEKTYKINGNGAQSTIYATIYIYSNSKDADNNFEANQRFYENKSYIPLDTLNSKRKGSGDYYLVSFIKSQYKDYSDFLYLPSKISYASDVIIKYDNVIISLSETANKPVTNKEAVIDDIKNKLSLK